MDITPVAAFGLGFVAGLAVVGLVVPSLRTRLRSQYHGRLTGLEEALHDLRQERAEDREVNRRLRRELAIKTPANFESTRQERDWALEELEKLSAELKETASELADRDRSLRQARNAIHDIRLHLERNRFAGGPEVPADVEEALPILLDVEAVDEAPA